MTHDELVIDADKETLEQVADVLIILAGSVQRRGGWNSSYQIEVHTLYRASEFFRGIK